MASGLYRPEDHPDVVNSKQDFDPIDRFLWNVMRFATAYSTPGTEVIAPFEPDHYLTDYFSEQAVAAIEANRDRPFFLYLAHWAPHTPLQAALAAHDAEQAPPAWPSQVSVPINIDKDLSQPDAPADQYIYWSN